MRLDVVNSVTIRADRRTRNATSHSFAVHAPIVLGRYVGMTLTASLGEVRFEYWRPAIRRRPYVVAAMAVRAHRSFGVAVDYGMSVNAFLIRQERPIAYAGAFHCGFLAVAGSAGLGDVGSVDRRFRISSRKHRRHIAIT